MKALKTFALGLILSPMTVLADDSPWSNEVEFGFLLNRGNTHNTHVDTRYTNEYDANQWQNSLSLSSFVDVGKNADTRERQKTAEKYRVTEDVRFKFTPVDYVYAQADGQKDKFSAFDYEVTESIGYGRKLIDSRQLKWDAQIGPGGRHSRATRVDNSKIHHDELIGHAGTKVSYMLNEKAEISEDVTYDIGSNSQKTKSTTSFKAKVFDKVSLKLSYALEYNAKLPDTGKEQNHTDTTTTLTATYVF